MNGGFEKGGGELKGEQEKFTIHAAHCYRQKRPHNNPGAGRVTSKILIFFLGDFFRVGTEASSLLPSGALNSGLGGGPQTLITVVLMVLPLSLIRTISTTAGEKSLTDSSLLPLSTTTTLKSE